MSEDITHQFHSRNIDQIRGQSFETVLCAAAPGSMFEANNAPERDKARIDALTEHLSQLEARQFILISSIAVLADFAGQDTEDTQAFQTDLAYGRNRRRLEAFCAGHFEHCLILRLPALFGPGLKKNFLFDILNPVPTMLTPARMQDARDALARDQAYALGRIYSWDETLQMHRLDRAALDASGQRAVLEEGLKAANLSAIGFTNPASTYQFYNLARLPGDIDAALARNLDVLHLAVEPIQASEVYETVTGQQMPSSEARLHQEDLRTNHAAIRGRTGPYLEDRAGILEDLRRFFDMAGTAAA